MLCVCIRVKCMKDEVYCVLPVVVEEAGAGEKEEAGSGLLVLDFPAGVPVEMARVFCCVLCVQFLFKTSSIVMLVVLNGGGASEVLRLLSCGGVDVFIESGSAVVFLCELLDVLVP